MQSSSRPMSRAEGCRQLVLAQLHNVLLALRSNAKFSSSHRFIDIGADQPHPLLGLVAKTHTQALSPSGFQSMTEDDILNPLCAVCVSDDAVETVTSVSLSAIVAFLEHGNRLITEAGLMRVADAAFNSRSEYPDKQSHEAVVARVLQVYVSCARHPCASRLPEDFHVGMVRGAYSVSSSSFSSELLKRTADQAMNSIVAAFFERLVVAPPAVHVNKLLATDAQGSDGPEALAAGASDAERPARVVDCVAESSNGSAMIGYIAVLLAPEEVLSRGMRGTFPRALPSRSSSGQGSIADLSALTGEVGESSPGVSAPGDGALASRGKDGGGRVSGPDDRLPVASRHLKGLALTHTALYTIESVAPSTTSIGKDLLEHLRHQLCRSILVLGLHADDDIVLSQLLRTAHQIAKAASSAAVPQIRAFLELLHLAPLSVPHMLAGGGDAAVKPGSPARRTPGSPRSFLSLSQPAHSSALTSNSIGAPGSRSSAYWSATNWREIHERVEILLESLVEFCYDPSFAAFCVAHYDTSLGHPPILSQICDVLLTYCTHGDDVVRVKEGLRTGVSGSPTRGAGEDLPSSQAGDKRVGAYQTVNRDSVPSSSSSRTGHVPPLTQFQLLSFSALHAMLASVTERVRSFHGSWKATSPSLLDSERQRTVPGGSPGVSCESMERVRRLLASREEMKATLTQFAALFEEDPVKKAIPFLLNEIEGAKARKLAAPGCEAPADVLGVFDVPHPVTGLEIGKFLFKYKSTLQKRTLGDYIGELGRDPAKPSAADDSDGTLLAAWEEARKSDASRVGSLRFFETQLHAFMAGFDFKGKSLLQAIREMVFHTCLPREAQKIDRVMEAFATHWRLTNSDAPKEINPFVGTDGAFILSFSIIMLNTDLHSGKLDKSMTCADFIRMNRDIDDGKPLPAEFLTNIYNDVLAHQIITTDQMHLGFENDTTWHQLMIQEPECDEPFRSNANEPLSSASEGLSLIPGDVTLSCMSPILLYPYDEVVFRKIWNPCLVAFTRVIGQALVPAEQLSVGCKCDSLEMLEGISSPDAQVLRQAVGGMRQLAQTALHLNEDDVVDCTVQTLLDFVPLDLFDARQILTDIGNDARSLLCMREVFALVPICASGMREAWIDYSSFVLKVYLLGLISTDGTFGASASTASFNPSVAVDSALACPPSDAQSVRSVSSRCLSSIVETNPGIVAASNAVAHRGFQRKPGSTANGEGGGWLSGLWSGTSSSSDHKKRLQEERAQLAIQRVKDSAPSAAEVIGMVKTLNEESLHAFVVSLCDAATMSSSAATDGFAASFAIHFVTEVVAQAEQLSDTVFTVYMRYAEHTLKTIVSIMEQAGGRGPDKQGMILDERSVAGNMVFEYWRTLATRVAGAALRLMRHCATVEGRRDRVVDLLEMLVAVREDVFTLAIAEPLSTTQLDVVARSPDILLCGTRATVGALVSSIVLVGTAAPTADVKQRALDTLGLVVAHGGYDLLACTECVAQAILRVALAQVDESTSTPPGEDTGSQRRRQQEDEADSTSPRTKDEAATSNEPLGGVMAQKLCKAPESLAAICRQLSVEAEENVDERHVLWIGVLRALCELVVSSTSARESGDALLCLQRCVLDQSLSQHTPASIQALYDSVIFPLVERLCAPNPTGVQRIEATDTSPSRQAKGTVVSSGQVTPSGGGIGATAFIGNFFFGTTPTAASSQVPLERPDLAKPSGMRSGSLAAAETKCRVINLLPKPFLQYFSEANAGEEVFQELWQRILGTLYALYTSVAPTRGDASSSPLVDSAEKPHGSHDQGRGEAGEAVCEAVEETVKNMVYVLASTRQTLEGTSFMKKVPFFWTSTRNLLRPFDFAEPLLQFLAAAGY